MRKFVLITTIAAAMAAISAPAFAGNVTRLPEPLSLSLLAGGVAAIAAARHFRRK
jgi:hypothetical protein